MKESFDTANHKTNIQPELSVRSQKAPADRHLSMTDSSDSVSCNVDGNGQSGFDGQAAVKQAAGASEVNPRETEAYKQPAPTTTSEDAEDYDRETLGRLVSGGGSGYSAFSCGNTVNKQLAERRVLLNRRIRRGRIALLIFTILSLIEIFLQIASDSLRLPLSCTVSDLLTVYGLLSLPLFVAAFLPVIFLLAVCIFFRKDSMAFCRKLLIVFLWADLVLTLGLGGLPYGLPDRYLVTEMIFNLFLHIPLIWLVHRAVRGVNALEVLPEKEYEGDPFIGLR